MALSEIVLVVEEVAGEARIDVGHAAVERAGEALVDRLDAPPRCGKAKFIARRTSTLSNGAILALSSIQIMNEAGTVSTATFGTFFRLMISSGCRYCAMSTAPPCSSWTREAEVGTSLKTTVSIAGLPP